MFAANTCLCNSCLYACGRVPGRDLVDRGMYNYTGICICTMYLTCTSLVFRLLGCEGTREGERAEGLQYTTAQERVGGDTIHERGIEKDNVNTHIQEGMHTDTHTNTRKHKRMNTQTNTCIRTFTPALSLSSTFTQTQVENHRM